MVDFTEAQIQGPQVGPVSGGGQRPVMQPGPSAAASALNLFGQLMPTAQQMQQRAQARQEREAAGFVEQFSQTQLRIAEAVDMGQMSSQEARMRMRQAYSQAISNNPMLADEITSAHKNIIGTSGLGKVAAEGTEAEQRENALIREATSAGYVQHWMTQEQAREAAMAWQNIKVSSDELARLQAELTFRRGQVGLQADVQSLETGRITQERARIELANARDERQAQFLAGQISDHYYPVLRTNIEHLMSQVESGELEPQEAELALEGLYADIRQVSGQLTAHASSTFRDGMFAGYDRLYNIGLRTLRGELDRDHFQTQLDRSMAMVQLTATGDPETLATVGTLRLFDGAVPDLILNNEVSKAVTNSFQRVMQQVGSEIPPPDPTNSRESRALTDFFKGPMSEIVSGSPTMEQVHVDQMNRALNRLFEGVDVYESAIRNPDQFSHIAEFVASEDFRQFVMSDKAQISREGANRLVDVFSASYEQVALPLISREWEQARTDVGPIRQQGGILGAAGPTAQRPVGEVIQPVFAGGSLSFRAMDESPQVRRKVRELNENVASVVNQFIRVRAHSEFNDNYEEIYRELYEPLFSREEAGDD